MVLIVWEHLCKFLFHNKFRGSDGRDIVGIAPEANFIACRAWKNSRINNFGVEACLQYFLAPTKQDGTSPKPELAPDVKNSKLKIR
jgi:hypothetical protein